MPQYGWATCPEDVRSQVAALLEAFQNTLGEHLAGVYLHGSLAMGCFNPAGSDLDLLVITERPMLLEQKRAIAETLLRLSRHPAPIEISFLSAADLTTWRYPTTFDLHYSEDWRSATSKTLPVMPGNTGTTAARPMLIWRRTLPSRERGASACWANPLRKPCHPFPSRITPLPSGRIFTGREPGLRRTHRTSS